jgi:hypothetical protein
MQLQPQQHLLHADDLYARGDFDAAAEQVGGVFCICAFRLCERSLNVCHAHAYLYACGDFDAAAEQVGGVFFSSL